MKIGYLLGIFMYLLSKNGQMSVVLRPQLLLPYPIYFILLFITFLQRYNATLWQNHYIIQNQYLFLLGFLQLFYFGFQAIYRLSDYFCCFLIGKNGGILFVYQILIQSFLLKYGYVGFCLGNCIQMTL